MATKSGDRARYNTLTDDSGLVHFHFLLMMKENGLFLSFLFFNYSQSAAAVAASAVIVTFVYCV